MRYDGGRLVTGKFQESFMWDIGIQSSIDNEAWKLTRYTIYTVSAILLRRYH